MYAFRAYFRVYCRAKRHTATTSVADDRQVDSRHGSWAQRRHVATCHALAGCAGTRLRSEFEYEMVMTTHDSFPTGQV